MFGPSLVTLFLIFCPLNYVKLDTLPLFKLSKSSKNKFRYCTICSWNFIKNQSTCLLESSSYENKTLDQYDHLDMDDSISNIKCLDEGGMCQSYKEILCPKEELGLSKSLKIDSQDNLPATSKEIPYLKGLLLKLLKTLTSKQPQPFLVLKVSKLLVQITSELANKVQNSSIMCSDIKTIISLLIGSSSTLISNCNFLNKFDKTITKPNFVSRNRIRHNCISHVLFVYNNIPKVLARCIAPNLKETMIKTKHNFLWIKINNPLRFNNFSPIFKNQNAFFRISRRLKSYLASENRNIIVYFMIIKNLFLFSETKSVILLSIFEKSGKKIKRLPAPIDLFFRHEFKAKENDFTTKGVFYFPSTSDTSLQEESELLSIFRLEPLHFSGAGKIFIKFYNISTNEYKVLLSERVPPGFEEMKLYAQTVSAKLPMYEVSLKNQTKNSVNYLGLMPIKSNTVFKIHYSFVTRYVQCYSRFRNKWKSKGCEVGNYTNETLTHCQCWHLSLFGGNNILTPRRFNLEEDIKLIGNIKDSPMTTIVVVCILLLYMMALVWTRHNDRKDGLQRFVIVQDDNFPGEEQPYLLTVYTGLWIGSGTDANIGIRLYGTKGMSRIHNLQNSSQRKLLKANCDDWFLIFTQKSIGDIEKIYIFSDNTGPSPDWYCNKIMVYDLEGEKDFKFVIKKWVSLAEEDECVDFYCYPTSTKKNIRRDRILVDNVVFGLWETHLLLSIFSRHPKSSVTRSQRLSILVVMFLLKLMTSIMFYDLKSGGNIEYSDLKRRHIIEMESTLLYSPFVFIIIFCFKKSRIVTGPKNDEPMTLTSTQAVPLETGLEINQRKKATLKPSDHNEGYEPIGQKSFFSTSETLTLDEGEDDEQGEEKQKFDDSDTDNDDYEEVEEEEEEEEEELEEEESDEACWVSCYKQIKTLMFQVIPNKTVMPVQIAEEDEESAQVRKKWMYFAWLLCEVSIFASAFTIVMYSLKMVFENRKIWLLKGIKSSFQNIFFLAPVKILIFASVLAILYGQLQYIPSYECDTEAATKKSLAGDKRYLSKLLLLRKNRCYKPISSSHTQIIRFKERNWRRWRIIINFIVLIFMYMVLVAEVLLAWDGPFIIQGIHLEQMFDPQLNNRVITSFNFYEEYIKKVVVPAYDTRSWYNGVPIMNKNVWKQEMSFLKDYSSRLVGVPHLRQQRVKPDACSVNRLMRDKVALCNAPMTWSSIDRKGYAIGWTTPEKFTANPNSEWVFSDPKNSPLMICGYKTARCYLPGGYIVKLSYNLSSSVEIFNKLIKSEWFDSLTRVVFLEMVTCNVNVNFLSSVVLILEKLAVGSFYTHVQSFTLHPQTGDFINTISIIMLFTSYYLFRIILLFNRKGLKYLLSWTGLLDIFLNALLYMTMICIYLYGIARIDYLHQWQIEEESDLKITRDVFLYRELIRYETAILVVLIPTQLLHNFRFGKRFFVYFKILSVCTRLCLGLAFIILVSLLALHLISYVNSNSIYCFFNRAYNSITYCPSVNSVHSKLGPLNWFFWLIFIITALVASVAVIYSYKRVKDRSKYMDDFNMAVFIFKKLKSSAKRIKRNVFRVKKKLGSITNTRLRAGAEETVESLETDDIDMFPTNKSLTYTRQMCEDLTLKIDRIVDKLLDFENRL